MNGELYVSRYAAWAAGIDGDSEWDEWAAGKRLMRSGAEAPGIAFTDPLFRRRLSQISKMTIQVVHDLLPIGDTAKLLFLSFRGELAKQYAINKMLIEDNALMPAAFSLSVFNAPIALATMAFGLKGGYTALYPGNNSFATGLAAARAMMLSAGSGELAVVYADEMAPAEYAGLCSETLPFAFGFILGKEARPGSIPFSVANKHNDTPEGFLKGLLLSKKEYAAS